MSPPPEEARKADLPALRPTVPVRARAAKTSTANCCLRAVGVMDPATCSCSARAWFPVKRMSLPIPELFPKTSRKRETSETRPQRAFRRWMVGEREGPSGQGSRELILGVEGHVFVGSQTPTLRSDPGPSSLRTETTSQDEWKRVQLSFTLEKRVCQVPVSSDIFSDLTVG